MISGWILLRIKKYLKRCIENQNTRFVYNNYFPKIFLSWDGVEKLGTAGEATEGNVKWRMRLACWICCVVLWTPYTKFPLLCQLFSNAKAQVKELGRAVTRLHFEQRG